MDLNGVASILAMAPGASGAAGGQPQSPLMTFAPFVLMIVMIYFLLFRPQQQKMKQQQAMLKALKSGDRVGTASGIVGVVISIKDNLVTVKSGDSKLEMSKSSITEVLSSDSPAAS